MSSDCRFFVSFKKAVATSPTKVFISGLFSLGFLPTIPDQHRSLCHQLQQSRKLRLFLNIVDSWRLTVVWCDLKMEPGELRSEILIPSTPSINLHVLILKYKCFQNNPLQIGITSFLLVILLGTFDTQVRLNFHHDNYLFWYVRYAI